MKIGPTYRRRRWVELRRWATTAGRLDAAGQFGSMGMALLRAARRQAAAEGVLAIDVDEATIEGLERGRWSMTHG